MSTIESLSGEIVESMQTTGKDAALLASRYAELKAAQYVIPATGEVLTATDYEREMDYLKSMLKEYMERTRERPFIEGVGTLRLQERKGQPEYDTKAIYLSPDRDNFIEAIDLGIVEISHKKATAQQDRLGWLKRWAIPGKPSTALVIDKGDK